MTSSIMACSGGRCLESMTHVERAGGTGVVRVDRSCTLWRRRAIPARRADVRGRATMAATCTHLDQIRVTQTPTRVCEECVRMGDTWVHLRLCLECGHVGCCDSS